MRIAIIDDSPLILSLLRSTLEANGHEVHIFEDPGKFDPKELTPDLILVDINMPQFFGDDIVTYFKEEWPGMAPIYLFSNVPEEELEQRAKGCGADGFISKNWGLDRLVASVQSIAED